MSPKILSRRPGFYNLPTAASNAQSTHSFTTTAASASMSFIHHAPATPLDPPQSFIRRSTRVASFHSCPNPWCNLSCRHTYEGMVSTTPRPEDIPQLHVYRFHPPSYHPFLDINVWAVDDKSKVLVFEGSTVFIDGCGIVTLHLWPERQECGWQGFNCISKEGILAARVLVHWQPKKGPKAMRWGKWIRSLL